MKAKLFQLLKTFVITVLVAFIATNKENYIYKVIDIMGYEEQDTLKKTVLSAVITICVGFLSIIISWLVSKIKSNFHKMNISFSTKINGSKRNSIKFTPNNYEYSPEDVEVEIDFDPGGWMTNLLIKKFDISLNVYFNPELLDVSFLDDWDTNENRIFKISERKIVINLLGKMELEGKIFKERSHKLNEQFRIKPIRVKKAETSLDLIMGSDKFNSFAKMISKFLLSVDFESLKVTCKGE